MQQLPPARLKLQNGLSPVPGDRMLSKNNDEE